MNNDSTPTSVDAFLETTSVDPNKVDATGGNDFRHGKKGIFIYVYL